MENQNSIEDQIASAYAEQVTGQPIKIKEDEKQENEQPQEQGTESSKENDEKVQEQQEEKQVDDLEGVDVDALKELAEKETETASQTEESTSEEKNLENDTEDVDNLVFKKTEGKFSSVDELVEALNSTNQTQEEVFASERIKKLNELEKAGADIEQVLYFESLKIEDADVDNTDVGLDLIKMKLKLEDPYMTDLDIEDIIDEKYSMYEDDDDDEIARTKRKITRDAKKAKDFLLKKKKEVELPKSEAQQKNIEQQKEIEKQQAEWKNTVTQSLSDYKSQKFTFGDSGEFEFAVDDKTKQQIEKDMLDPVGFWSKYQDMDTLKRDLLVLNNLETVLKSIADQYKSKGRKELLDEFRVPASKTDSSAAQNKQPSIAEQIAKQMFK